MRHLRLLLPMVMLFASTATPVSAYPPADAGYIDYPEMVAAIHAIAARGARNVELFSIGQSFAGRELWAAKVSDNVEIDEREPEVVFDGGMHAREHMTTEMAVALFRNLVDHYGVTPRVTNLVDRHEIYIIFNLNPDGSEYDHVSGTYRFWRKNRQPTPGTGQVGTDINRNFSYRWGTNPLNASPSAETYRGPAAWSAPEASAFRRFVESRVLNGRQQIRVHVTFHQYGRIVLYPYGYTTAALPSDMRREDHDVLVAMAKEMGRRSAYSYAQSSAGEVNVGNQMDWLYATHRIMTFTFEMGDRFYMPDEAIATETARNMDAAYYSIEQASCPYAVTGRAADLCHPSGFTDVAASRFGVEIGWAADAGVTAGCGPRLFCPTRVVTREQMASFLARVLNLPPATRDFFTDGRASPHRADINRIAAAGIATGCGGGRFCPGARVTREQMASFLARAYDLPASGTDHFADDDGSIHAGDIDRLAASGITAGCAPTRYCPGAPVTREQMVAFLYRAERLVH